MSDERASGGLALFGGTFDPPHIGHLSVAQDAFDTLPVRSLVWMPCGRPPHKRSWRRPASPQLRLEMTRAAIADDDRFVVSDLEVRRKGMSYTVDTLREIRAHDPETEVFLLIGPDQAAAFRTWREPDEIARLARVVVMVPGGSGFGRVPSPGVEHEELSVTRVDVSSSEIRARLREGRRLRHLVPDAVRAIVEREELYRRDERKEIAAAGVATRRATAAVGRRHVTTPGTRWTNP